MAKNPNPNKKNRHALYLGASGSGKSTALRKAPMMKRSRRVMWDPGHDHKVQTRARSCSAFLTHLATQNKAGPIDLALSLDRGTPEQFAFFCRAVWSILDGRHDTVIVVEELAGVTGTAKAAAEFGTMIREGRKFGAVLLATSQRGQEIPKTLLSQVQSTYIGQHGQYDQPKVAKALGLNPELFEGLQIGQFLQLELGGGPAEIVDFRPKKPAKRKTPGRSPK